MKDIFSDLDQEVDRVLRPIFDEYVNRGYRPRQIAHVMQGSVLSLELMKMVEKRDKR